MPSKIRPEPVIPDHEVLRKIGGGSYGEVWLARGVTGAMRAVKVVWRDDFDDEREFEREFEGILRYEPISRDHPALVHILHVGRSVGEEAFYYYVMELGDDIGEAGEFNPVEYEPRNLRVDMKQAAGARLDTAFCVEAGRSLAEGLGHLHGNGLAHRDVKPANVIFVDGKAKLADIGLVALRGQRTFVGTEGFVPPEGPGSAQADVYSLGKVLYEMATGKDRLDFPELPEDLPEGKELKLWRGLNAVICDVCEPRLSKRKLLTADMLAEELSLLEQGMKRPVRVSPGVTLGVLLATVVMVGGWQFLPVRPVVIRAGTGEDAPFVAPVLETGLVTVTSSPLGAEVYSDTGEYLKDTPLRPMRMPVGTEVEFVFRLEGFQTTRAGGVVTEEGLVIDPRLRIYAPPVNGDPWVDILGMTYHPEEDYHVSHYYVGAAEWRLYQKEENRKGAGQVVQLTQNGRQQEVVLTGQGEAKQFMKWLTEHCRDGYLTRDHEMEPRMDRQRDLLADKVNPQWVNQGLRPFWSVVRYIPPARIMITSEPTGAAVYLNGVLRGYTPMREEGGEPGIRVQPGKVKVVVEAEGYKVHEEELTLKAHESWDEPMHVVLRENQGVVFGKSWENSLGMKLEPVGADLMAATWETRIRDYHEYLKAEGKREPASQLIDEGKDPALPVVFVSRQDAADFCKWLTAIEQKRERISKNHEYRLPTDREWSLMAGLDAEVGEWPQMRDVQQGEFPWGEDWPPPDGAGNLAGSLEGALESKAIPGYSDGHEKSAPVGLFDPNVYGLFDLAGNVHEWVSDDLNPGGTHGVLRGGGWNTYQEDNLRSAFRNAVRLGEESRKEEYGFRVVLAKRPTNLESSDADAPDGPDQQP